MDIGLLENKVFVKIRHKIQHMDYLQFMVVSQLILCGCDSEGHVSNFITPSASMNQFPH